MRYSYIEILNTFPLSQVRASTRKGPGPYSQSLVLTTHQDLVRAPINLQGMATSESSIEIWWEPVPSHGKLIGYQVNKIVITKHRLRNKLTTIRTAAKRFP